MKNHENVPNKNEILINDWRKYLLNDLGCTPHGWLTILRTARPLQNKQCDVDVAPAIHVSNETRFICRYV